MSTAPDVIKGHANSRGLDCVRVQGLCSHGGHVDIQTRATAKDHVWVRGTTTAMTNVVTRTHTEA